ncbi:hypothetical protein ACFLSJ_04895 [Verrucomicrobiota bacterium]
MDEENKRRFHPTDEDLVEALSRMLSDDHYEMSVHIWLEDFERRGDSGQRAIGIVRRWMAQQESIEGLRVGAACLRRVGERADLALLERDYVGPQEEVASIRQNTAFEIRKRSLV